MCGALLVAGFSKGRHRGRNTLLILTVLGVLIAGFSLSRWLPLSCVLIFACGMSLISVFTQVTSLVQTIATDNMRGRVMSVYNVAFRGGMPVGSLVLGRVIPMYGVSFTIACVGGMLTVMAFYFLLVHRRIASL